MLELIKDATDLEQRFLSVPDGETPETNPNVQVLEFDLAGEHYSQLVLNNPIFRLPREEAYLEKIEKSLYQDGSRELKDGVDDMISVSRRYYDNDWSFKITPRQPAFIPHTFSLTELQDIQKIRGGHILDPQVNSPANRRPWPVAPLEVELAEHDPEERVFELLINGGGFIHTIKVYETGVNQIKKISVFETDIDDDGDLDYIFAFFAGDQTIVGGAIYLNHPVTFKSNGTETDSLEFGNE